MREKLYSKFNKDYCYIFCQTFGTQIKFSGTLIRAS